LREGIHPLHTTPSLPPLRQTRITIVGTGLMGTSLAMALRGHVAALHGVDLNAEVRALAASHYDTVGTEIPFAETDVLILATPARAILKILADVAKQDLPAGFLVTDICGTKAHITAAMEALPDHMLAVGGHPMCGKETAGPAGAEGALFRGKTYVICPNQRSTPAAVAFIENLVATIGAKALVVKPTDHDQAVAFISHMPHILSNTLVNTVERNGHDMPWRLAASGFRDMTRLANGDVTMILDTMITNRESILRALDAYLEQLNLIRDMLASEDYAGLSTRIHTARIARIAWAEGKKP
jgi:prephenate dehydrogenase